MKVFLFLRSVLDEIWQQLPGETDDEKRSVVRQRETYLHATYAQLTKVTGAIDYKSPETRYAYIACYVASHANMVAQLIGSTPELVQLFQQPKITVCCIGGGPGSDLVGVLKYAESEDLTPKLMFWLFDREQAWSDSWADLNEKLDWNIATQYNLFDVTNAETWTVHAKYLQSDLFTMIYFLSEVHHCREQALSFFASLFSAAKSGAYFLFVDNSSSQFYDWFDKLWTEAGLKQVAGTDKKTLYIPVEEEKKDLGNHYSNIAGCPKLTGDIAYRVLRKA